MKRNMLIAWIKRITIILFSLMQGLLVFAQTEETKYEDLLASASQGDVRAQAMVAYRLKEGLGVTKDVQEAKKWATAAAQANDGLAYWLLAQITRESGAPAAEYKDYLGAAFSRGYPLAIPLFARLYDEGAEEYGIEKNRDVATMLFEESAENGDVEAMALLGYRYYSMGYDLSAKKYLQLAVDNGDVESMGLLANLFHNGAGIEDRPDSVFVLYKNASEAGSRLGLEGFADCYRVGEGCPVSLDEATGLYSRITEGSPRLSYLQGFSYLNGKEKDENRSLELLERSASQGYVFAQALLGLSLYEGKAPFEHNKSIERAFLYLKAAYDNSSFEQLPDSFRQKIYRNLSGYYRYGKVVKKSIPKAEELFSKANAVVVDETASVFPFGYVGMLSREEALGLYSQKELTPVERILTETTTDYPDHPSDEAWAKLIILPQSSAKPTHYFLAQFEITPVGQGAIVSEQSLVSWSYDLAIGVAGLLGVQYSNGMYYGARIGYDRFTTKKLSIVHGMAEFGFRFVDLNYHFSKEKWVCPYIAFRSGVGYETSHLGAGLSLGAMLGGRLKMNDHFAIDLGARWALVTFYDEYKTKCSLIAPAVVLEF